MGNHSSKKKKRSGTSINLENPVIPVSSVATINTKKNNEKLILIMVKKSRTNCKESQTHIHLTENQCNVLLFGYIRRVEKISKDMNIAIDIYNECWKHFKRLNDVKKQIFEVGEFYQGYECQINSLHKQSIEYKHSIHMQFIHKVSPNKTDTNPDIKWIISEKQKAKYNEPYSTDDNNLIMSKSSAIQMMQQKSQINKDTLEEIFKLSDIDMDDMLDADEFALFNYLIDMVLKGAITRTKLEFLTSLPNLPMRYIPPSKRSLLFSVDIRWIWLDYQGTEQDYTSRNRTGRLRVNGQFTQQTYVSHPWKLFNGKYFLGLYIPTLEYHTHEIELVNDPLKKDALFVKCMINGVRHLALF
eukprot:531642_1